MTKELDDMLLDLIEAENSYDIAWNKYDVAKQWFETAVWELVHNESMQKTKAEAKVMTEEAKGYKKMRELKREAYGAERLVDRMKRIYYHHRKAEDTGREIDIEASRLWKKY